MRLSLSPTLAFTAGAVIATLVTASLLRKRKRTAEEHLWSIVRNSFTGALLHVGDKLNLYEILAETGPTTSQALARRTGWSERWLQEFLAQAAAAGICVYDEFNFTFAIRPDYARLLRDPKVSAVSMAGMFQFLLPLLKRADSVEKAIRTGLGVDYDFGVDGIEAMDRKNSNWFRDHLVKDLLSKVTVPSTNQTLVQLLESGVNVADIGCGCGSSTLVMAKRFPNSHFYAYEASVRSLGILSRRIEEQCLSNVSVCNVAERSVRDGPHFGGEFLFAYSHDVIHDITYPQKLIRDVKNVLAAEGCWVIVDTKCYEKLADNLHLPIAEILYGYSCLLCLSSATSTHDGAGLGTCGFPAALARQWTSEAGFEYFREMSIPSMPMESCFVVA